MSSLFYLISLARDSTTSLTFSQMKNSTTSQSASRAEVLSTILTSCQIHVQILWDKIYSASHFLSLPPPLPASVSPPDHCKPPFSGSDFQFPLWPLLPLSTFSSAAGQRDFLVFPPTSLKIPLAGAGFPHWCSVYLKCWDSAIGILNLLKFHLPSFSVN